MDKSKKTVNKVINGSVKTKKKSEITKLAEVFLADDIDDIKCYIFKDIVIPTVKRSFLDMLNIMFYGETVGPKKRPGETRVSYNGYYPDDRRTSNRSVSSGRNGYEYGEIVLENRADVEEVLDGMSDVIEHYGMVSVADLYDLVGITGSPTDNGYGWTDIRNASVSRVRDGYLLKLPRALPFN